MIEKVDEKGGIWSYNYHPSGLMGSVTRPDGKDVTFAYDAVGRRISKSFDDRTTRFLWDGNEIIHEWVEDSEQAISNDPQIITWLFEDETFVPIALLTKEKAYSIIADHLGTPFSMLDPDERKVWNKAFDLFGAEVKERRTRTLGEALANLAKTKAQDNDGVNDSATYCPFRFQVQYHDTETGLYYNRFRYYDPDTGIYT